MHMCVWLCVDPSRLVVVMLDVSTTTYLSLSTRCSNMLQFHYTNVVDFDTLTTVTQYINVNELLSHFLSLCM